MPDHHVGAGEVVIVKVQGKLLLWVLSDDAVLPHFAMCYVHVWTCSLEAVSAV